MSKIKNLISGVVLILLVSIVMTSCSKMPQNGDLDGVWQVMYLSVDGKEVPKQEGTPNSYIYIQRSVVQLARPDVGATGNMHYDNDKLSFDFPYSPEDPEERLVMSYFGIYEPEITYTIRELTKKRLVMESARTRLECRKF